jgi:hypothetical protein
MIILVEVIPNSTISSLPDATLERIFAYIYFTNIDPSCNNSASMPDQVQYTLRMQEYDLDLISIIFIDYFAYRNGLDYYRAHKVKLAKMDILWKRSPEDYCQGIYLNLRCFEKINLYFR